MATLTLPQGIGGLRAGLSARTSALLVIPWEVSMFTDMDSAGQLRWRLSDSSIAILALPTLLGVIQVRPSFI